VRIAIARTRAIPPAAALIAAAAALLSADVLAGGAHSKYPPLVVIGLLLVMAGIRIAKRWSWLTAGMMLVVLLIPSDGRYTLSDGLPFQLEPYRLVVGILIIGWVIALLVDPRVRARSTKFEGPISLIVIATLGSELVNAHRLESVSTNVIKALWLFACFVLFVYLTVSVIRTRRVVEKLLAVIVAAGCVEALGAVYQRRTGNNIFNSLHALIPIFKFNPVALIGTDLSRGGSVRATASAGHPIELSSTMAMLIPLAVYLAISRKQKRWWLAALVLTAGDFSGGSRTGIIGIAVLVLVFLWLRPRQTLRCWPALIPAVVVVHVMAPGALGGLQAAFFPKGGLLQQQTQTFVGHGGVVQDDTRLSRLGPSFQEFSQHDPLFGEGYATRVVGLLANGQPNPKDNAEVLDDQWLGTLLMTGLLGVIGWVWLFGSVVRRLGRRSKVERGSPAGWLPVALAASVAAYAASMFTYDAFGFIQATFMMFTLVALSSVILQLPPVTERLKKRAPKLATFVPMQGPVTVVAGPGTAAASPQSLTVAPKSASLRLEHPAPALPPGGAASDRSDREHMRRHREPRAGGGGPRVRPPDGAAPRLPRESRGDRRAAASSWSGSSRVVRIGALVTVLIAAGVAILASQGISRRTMPTSVKSGPLSVRYQSPWHSTSVPAIGAFALRAPANLTSGVATLALGTLNESAAVPGGIPPQLAARYGHPAASTVTVVQGHGASLYEWDVPGDRRLLALVIPTGQSDLALLCAGSERASSALASCDGVVSLVSVSGKGLVAPGLDRPMAAAIGHDLAPVSDARADLNGLRAGSLSSRAAAARAVADAESSALKSLARMTPLERNRAALGTLRNALTSESAAFAAIAKAAGANDAVGYATAREHAIAASKQLSAAARLLVAQGFAPPSLPILTLAPPPAVHSASNQQGGTLDTESAIGGRSPGNGNQARHPTSTIRTTPPSTSQLSDRAATSPSPSVVVVPTGSRGTSRGSGRPGVVVVPTG
jgi:hypothetical protein